MVSEYTQRVRRAIYNEMSRAGAKRMDIARVFCIDSRDLTFGDGPQFTTTAIADLLSHSPSPWQATFGPKVDNSESSHGVFLSQFV
jgi:hypothetical protein